LEALRKRQHPQLFRVVVLTIVLVKGLLAIITPGSSDFINSVQNGATLYSPGGYAYLFSVFSMNIFYRIWLLIPVDHSWIYSGLSFIPLQSSFLALFLFKLPLLISDVLISVLIFKCVSLFTTSQKTARLAALIWLLNPYLTVVIEMDGTMDIMSTFLVVLATYFFLRHKDIISGICLAVATAARFYPIALIPFYILVLGKEGKARDYCLMVTSYVATLIGVLVLLVAHYGVSFLNDIYRLPIGGNWEFLWFFGFQPSVASTSGMQISSVVTVMVVLALLVERVWKTDRRLVLDAVLVVLVIYVGLSHFNRYYTVWATPFLTLSLALNLDGTYRKVYAALFALFFASAFVYNTAYWWSSSLLFVYEFTPQMMEMSKSMREIGSVLTQRDLGTTFSQSILAGACVIYSALTMLRNSIGHRPRCLEANLAHPTSLMLDAKYD